MINDIAPTLKIDPVFQRLVQPLGKIYLASLRAKLISDPSLRILQTWNGVLLFEYEKYRLCNSMNLSFQVDEKSFTCFEQAASYICSSQLKRTDLTSEYRKYLIGELFLFEEKHYLLSNPEHPNSRYRIAYKIGEDINLSGGTVLKYSTYALAINEIFDNSSDFSLQILMGKTKVSHSNVKGSALPVSLSIFCTSRGFFFAGSFITICAVAAPSTVT